jgi:hypothetical protein
MRRWPSPSSKESPRRNNAALEVVCYMLFGTLKKRNRHIFTGKRLTYTEVASIMRDNILQSEHAFIAFEPAIPAELD